MSDVCDNFTAGFATGFFVAALILIVCFALVFWEKTCWVLHRICPSCCRVEECHYCVHPNRLMRNDSDDLLPNNIDGPTISSSVGGRHQTQ